MSKPDNILFWTRPELREEVERLKVEITKLEHSINYWIIEAKTDHDRWIRTLEENEKIRNELNYSNKIGTALYVKSLNWPCAKHYKNESQAWAEYINSKNINDQPKQSQP
jgi:hypothetical protein